MEKVKKVTEEAQKYHISELIIQSRAIFRVNPEVVRGAVHGAAGDEFTIDEVRGLIKAFLERKVV